MALRKDQFNESGLIDKSLLLETEDPNVKYITPVDCNCKPGTSHGAKCKL